jgi:YVTN family beta-propeller protein
MTARVGAGWFFCGWVLALGALGTGCNDDESVTCPTVGTDGPALNPNQRWLVVAHGLSEDWMAVNLFAEPPVVRPERGLTGRAPNDLDVVGDRIYVVNSGENSVTVIDAASGRVVGCIPTGAGTNPWEFAVDPEDSTHAWVSTFLSGEVLELSLNTFRVIRRVVVGPTMEGLWVGPDRVAVTLTGFDLTDFSYGQGLVVVLDKTSLAEVTRTPVPTNPQFLLRGADERVHVVCTGDFAAEPGRVVRLEPTWAARDTLVLGGTPARGVVSASGTAYVAGYLGGVMSYDSESFTVLHDAEDPVVSGVGFTALTIGGTRLYAANFDADAVTVVRLSDGVVTGAIPVHDGPSALAVYP